MCQVSHVTCHGSSAICQMSGVMCHHSIARKGTYRATYCLLVSYNVSIDICHVSHVKCPVSTVSCKMLDVTCQVSDVRCKVSCTTCLEDKHALSSFSIKMYYQSVSNKVMNEHIQVLSTLSLTPLSQLTSLYLPPVFF